MSRYRRNDIGGGTFFFTVKLADPKSRLLVEHIDLLQNHPHISNGYHQQA